MAYSEPGIFKNTQAVMAGKQHISDLTTGPLMLHIQGVQESHMLPKPKLELGKIM